MSTKGLLPREQAILTEIIEYYFAHHQAISARTLSKISHLSLSPTTIRNLMEDLSEAGYLTPYGAARGRVPTQKAFYIYISALRPRAARAESAEAQTAPRELASAQEAESLEALLDRIGAALAGRTGYAAVAWLPSRESEPLAWVRFSPVGAGRVLVALGTAFGDVWSKVLRAAEPIEAGVFAELQGFLCERLAGRTIAQVREWIMRGEPLGALEGAPSPGAAFRLLRRAFEWGDDPRHAVWGESGLFEAMAFPDAERLVRVLRALHDPELLPRAQKRGRPIEGGWVAIGQETGQRALDDLSLVAFPFDSGQDWRGWIGVAGPMHMDYGRVLQSVQGAAQALERHVRAGAEQA